MTDKISYMIPELDDERGYGDEYWPDFLAEIRDDCEPAKTGVQSFAAMKMATTYHRASIDAYGNVVWETQPPAHDQLAVVFGPDKGWFEEDIYDSAADYFSSYPEEANLPTWFAVLDHAREGYIATVDWDKASVAFEAKP